MAKTEKKASGGNASGNKLNLKSILVIVAIVAVLWVVNEKVAPGILNGAGETSLPEQITAEDVQQDEESSVTEVKEESKSVTGSDKREAESKKIGGVSMPSRVGNNQIVEHKVYTLSYNDTHEQADWVFYMLTKSMVTGQTIRSNDFREDPSVEKESAYNEDYTGSGYSRGHLCPSADVRTDEEAQSETFYMSNMSPQLSEFNAGVWNDLEMKVRHWAKKHSKVWVATGPVLKKGLKKIGKKTRVSVPEWYYKIVYCSQSGGRMVAFMMPNEDCEGHMYDEYQVTVDEIEETTGINFFSGVANEESLEREIGELEWWN